MRTKNPVQLQHAFVKEGELWVPRRNKCMSLGGGQTDLPVSSVITDSFTRRTFPGASEITHGVSCHIVAFGCSYTWGEGVNDDQTILAHFSLADRSLATFNLGVSAYGYRLTVCRVGQSEDPPTAG